MNFLTISIPEISVPIVENRFANITTSKVLVTRFFQNPFRSAVSILKSSKSLTLGFLIEASTIPANHPEASKGFNDVIGAAIKAVRTDNGWPSAHITPKADNVPCHKAQDLS